MSIFGKKNMVESLHILNGCLIVPATLALAIILLVQHWQGKGLSPVLLAAILVVGLLVFAQMYLGISLLSNRGQRSVLHYSLGVLPLLLLMVTLWLLPQTRSRPALTAGVGCGLVAVLVTAAFFLG